VAQIRIRVIANNIAGLIFRRSLARIIREPEEI